MGLAAPFDGMLDVTLPDLFTMAEWRVLARQLGLTIRQAQVARLICRGLSNPEIAHALSISRDTVRLHRRCLFRRLKITDRVGLPVRLVLAARELDDPR